MNQDHKRELIPLRRLIDEDEGEDEKNLRGRAKVNDVNYPPEIIMICVALVSGLIGFGIGQRGASALPPPTLGQKITQLHSYMHDPYTRRAWVNYYCRHREIQGGNHFNNRDEVHDD